MRTLEFDVNATALSKSSNCDFSGLIKGSKKYLVCHFTFDNTWDGARRIVEFQTKEEDKFYELTDENACYVPDDFAAENYFKVSIHGVKDKEQFETNKVLIRQTNG